MIWLILGCLSAGAIFGFVICGLLTNSRIKQLESLLARICEADVKKREEEVKIIREIFSPREANERIRPQSRRTH